MGECVNAPYYLKLQQNYFIEHAASLYFNKSYKILFPSLLAMTYLDITCLAAAQSDSQKLRNTQL